MRHGVPDNTASGVLNLTLNIVRGFALRRFMDDNPKQRAELTELWQDMVRCYLEKNLSSHDFAAVYPPTKHIAGHLITNNAMVRRLPRPPTDRLLRTRKLI